MGRRGEAAIIRCLVWPRQLPAEILTLSTEMVHLAEDGAMFKIARFEKQLRYTSGPQRNPPNH